MGLIDGAGGDVRGNTAGNIINSGYAAIQGGWIYYYDCCNSAFCRIRADGSGKTRLNGECNRYTNVAGDWIYYGDGDSSGFIRRIRIDGTEKMQLNEDISWYVSVAGGWIYYQNRSRSCSIYKIRTDGTERTQLNDDRSDYINVAGGWIYYINRNPANASDEIRKIRIDGTGGMKLYDIVAFGGNRVVAGMIVDGDWIYLTDWNDRKFYKLRTDGTKKIMLRSEPIEYFNVPAAGFII